MSEINPRSSSSSSDRRLRRSDKPKGKGKESKSQRYNLWLTQPTFPQVSHISATSSTLSESPEMPKTTEMPETPSGTTKGLRVDPRSLLKHHGKAPRKPDIPRIVEPESSTTAEQVPFRSRGKKQLSPITEAASLTPSAPSHASSMPSHVSSVLSEMSGGHSLSRQSGSSSEIGHGPPSWYDESAEERQESSQQLGFPNPLEAPREQSLARIESEYVQKQEATLDYRAQMREHTLQLMEKSRREAQIRQLRAQLASVELRSPLPDRRRANDD